MTDAAIARRPEHVEQKSRAQNAGAGLLTLLTVICAAIWVFPLYWALVTT